MFPPSSSELQAGVAVPPWGPWVWGSSRPITSVILYRKPDPTHPGHLLIQEVCSTQGTGGEASGTFRTDFMGSSGFRGSGAGVLWQALTLLHKEGLSLVNCVPSVILTLQVPAAYTARSCSLLQITTHRLTCGLFLSWGKYAKFKTHTHTGLSISLSTHFPGSVLCRPSCGLQLRHRLSLALHSSQAPRLLETQPASPPPSPLGLPRPQSPSLPLFCQLRHRRSPDLSLHFLSSHISLPQPPALTQHLAQDSTLPPVPEESLDC